MKRKRSEKKGHVVAWVNKAEWDQILEYLYSADPALQRFALHRISAWRGRCANSSPLAVDCTADLVRCQVLDRSGQLAGDDLVLMYGAALVRFINLITERHQGKVARSLRFLAKNLNIPEWVVNLRHDFTHHKLPTLKWCRKGCQVVLEWLQQEYWLKQLGGDPNQDWGSQFGGEDEEVELRQKEDDLMARQKEVEAYKKARDLLISFEKEQYQASGGRAEEPGGLWPAPLSDMSWLLAEIKQFASDSSHLFIDVLLEDGFLVPTVEQLETLGCECWDGAPPSEPTVPQPFLQFWLPLLKMLNSPSFVHLLLDKLFVELKLLSSEQNDHRAFYVSAWISEVLVCNSSKSEVRLDAKTQKKARVKDRVLVNRVPLRWQQLLSACLGAPCFSTPHLLRLILEDMEHPLPLETRERLLQLCSIYTRTTPTQSDASPKREQQPVYTLETLQHSVHPRSFPADSETSPSSEDTLGWVQAEKAKSLRGSPWQVCTDKVTWRDYPLGKVPGQSDDPSCLMVENYSTMTVLDQQVEFESSTTRSLPAALGQTGTAEGRLWNQTDFNRLKSGLMFY